MKFKKRSAGPYQFLHFLTISFVSLLNKFVDGIRSKKKPCRFGARMMLILTWRFAKPNGNKMFSPSAWRDEEVETLIHIFSRETTLKFQK